MLTAEPFDVLVILPEPSTDHSHQRAMISPSLVSDSARTDLVWHCRCRSRVSAVLYLLYWQATALLCMAWHILGIAQQYGIRGVALMRVKRDEEKADLQRQKCCLDSIYSTTPTVKWCEFREEEKRRKGKKEIRSPI